MQCPFPVLLSLNLFQKDSMPAHKNQLTQEYMATNLHKHIALSLWPPDHFT